MPYYTYTRPSISRQGLTFHFGQIPDFWLQLISVLVAEIILLDTYQVLADDKWLNRCPANGNDNDFMFYAEENKACMLSFT